MIVATNVVMCAVVVAVIWVKKESALSDPNYPKIKIKTMFNPSCT